MVLLKLKNKKRKKGTVEENPGVVEGGVESRREGKEGDGGKHERKGRLVWAWGRP